MNHVWRLVVAALVLIASAVGAAPGAAAPDGQDDVGASHLARPDLVRSRRDAGNRHAVPDKAVYAQGPRVAESGLGLITGWAFSAPYEDVKLKGK